MEIIILGLVLLILGVGGIYAYDKYKAALAVSNEAHRQIREKATAERDRRIEAAQQRLVANAKSPTQKKSQEQVLLELAGIRFEKPNPSPDEAAKSVQELIDMIEQMAKRAGKQ